MENLAELKSKDSAYASIRALLVKEAFKQIKKTGFKFRIVQNTDTNSYSCDEIKVFIDRKNTLTKEDINAVCYIIKSLYSFVANDFVMLFENDDEDSTAAKEDFFNAMNSLCVNKEEESEFLRNLDFFGIDLN